MAGFSSGYSMLYPNYPPAGYQGSYPAGGQASQGYPALSQFQYTQVPATDIHPTYFCLLSLDTIQTKEGPTMIESVLTMDVV